jgi:hypothetical protein
LQGNIVKRLQPPEVLRYVCDFQYGHKKALILQI